MRPLTTKELPDFVLRFGNFVDAEIRSVDVVSAAQIKLTIAVQDKARAFDWISIELEFTDIQDAKLIQNEKLTLLDMSEGANIIDYNKLFAFGIGECYNNSSIKSSTLFIIAKELKYTEKQF